MFSFRTFIAFNTLIISTDITCSGYPYIGVIMDKFWWDLFPYGRRFGHILIWGTVECLVNFGC